MSAHAAFLANVILVFIPEEFDAAGNRAGGKVAQCTERFAADIRADIQQQVEVAHLALTTFDSLYQTGQPVGSFSTWRAFATGFLAVELRDALDCCHNIDSVMEHDDAT